jgi:hypothetical protein
MTVASLITALIGVLIAGISLLVAILAKSDSKTSRQIAEREEKTSLKANELSSEANRIAVDARKLAEDANSIATRAESRSKEANYVSWEIHWPDPGECRIVNIGQDDALDVTVTLSVDREKMSSYANLVAPGGEITLTFPRLGDELTTHQAEFEASERRYEAGMQRGDWYAAGPIPLDIPLKFTVVGDIWWKSQLETPHVHHVEDRECFCED